TSRWFIECPFSSYPHKEESLYDLEEEHLLESPYQTNCTDYVYIWEKNNKTGPRSQEMCREWCWWNFFQSCEDCEQGLTMVEKPLRHCNYFGLLVV
ncbi:hypothetical protein NPIL_262121, partial [Nephila pilipes]